MIAIKKLLKQKITCIYNNIAREAAASTITRITLKYIILKRLLIYLHCIVLHPYYIECAAYRCEKMRYITFFLIFEQNEPCLYIRINFSVEFLIQVHLNAKMKVKLISN